MRIQTICGVLVVVSALAAPARSAQNGPDPAQRESTARMNVCGVCHGNNGVPKSPNIPIIWGQQQEYLTKQLHDFRSGDRSFEIMEWMTKTLPESEQVPAAANLAGRRWPAKAQSAAAAPAPRGVAVCQACHAANYMGAVRAEGMTTPRLAGQNYEYLVESMRRFADGERTNNADMVQIMKAISPADREEMARYLSTL